MTIENVNLTPVRILLIEDNEADIVLTIESLKESRVKNIIDSVVNGEAAIDFLHKKGEYANALKPDLIFLDLNLPKKDGREVLAEIKNDPNLRRIPVVILTSSSAEADVIKTYDLHANAYIQKPLDLDQFTKIVHSIEDFWLSIVKLSPL